ncbi:hypothetical protein GQ43DRAFT_429682 [Delitschia confertaspora ATCC 74209]|uniref:Uncharacterized protein n=1 Tax=Delitschia confertaspora ATCC 74209 TaxID=1513339 RepID=A0A9P4JSK3_9PLEO|nr:hypothetical protein GQ43DRAFT_429682 [Delitschia confertaspora ATCC 74209]
MHLSKPALSNIQPTSRLSLLTYLLPTQTQPDPERGPFLRDMTSCSKPLSPVDELDEEVLDYLGKYQGQHPALNGKWGVYDVLGAVFYALVIFAAVLNVDMMLSRLGWGRVAQWDSNVTGIQGPRPQITLCLVRHSGDDYSNSRIWKVQSPSADVTCNTVQLTIPVPQEGSLKLFVGDEIGVETVDEKPTETVEADREVNEIGSDVREGDDLAEEGKLRQDQATRFGGHGNIMHAGFGGTWRRWRGS